MSYYNSSRYQFKNNNFEFLYKKKITKLKEKKNFELIGCLQHICTVTEFL